MTPKRSIPKAIVLTTRSLERIIKLIKRGEKRAYHRGYDKGYTHGRREGNDESRNRPGDGDMGG
jgi:hypothetical protein